MKKLLISIIALWFSTAFAADSINAAQDLTTLLNDFHAMSADFSQTITDAHHKTMQKSSGSMALSRPGKFRWQVKQPNNQLLIADGNYLWIYDEDLSQATRQKLDVTKGNTPASLLSGSMGDLEQRFKVSRVGDATAQSFKLVPNQSGDLFRWVELDFQNGKLAQMRLLDSLGSLSVFNFKQVQVNPSLNPSLFQFKAPKGVDVVKN